ncbi:sugar efflux transporter [subsurface metagenome]
MAAGIVMALVGALGLGLSPNTWFLCLGRATAGIGAATWVTFTVYFAAYYPRESTGRAIGVINFVCGMAHVVSTSCGGVIAEVWGFGHTFFGAALLGVISLLALSFAREPTTHPAETTSRHNFIRVATQPVLLTVSFLGILSHFAGYAGTFGFIPVYGAKIGASSADLGIITMLAVGSAAVAALAAAHIAERWGNTSAIVLGAALVGIALLAVPFVTSVSVLGAVQVVNGLGGGVLRTTLMTLSIRAVAPQQRATAMGVYQAMYAVGMLSGPLVSGVLADSLGLSSIFYLFASLSVVIIGVACLPILPRH